MKHRQLRSLTAIIRPQACPVRGCNHSIGGHLPGSNTTAAIKTHLEGECHPNSFHLASYSHCQQVGIYLCTRASCRRAFTSAKALEAHDNDVHLQDTLPPTTYLFHSTSPTHHDSPATNPFDDEANSTATPSGTPTTQPPASSHAAVYPAS